MRYLIVYCSSHGTTKKATESLRNYLKGEVEVVNLEKVSNLQITDGFDVVIIGASIHVGNIQGKIKMFIEENLDLLFDKIVGLFLCCMREGDFANEQFAKNFPKELREHSSVNGLFGGELIFTEMNFFEKFMVRQVQKVKKDIHNIDEKAIKEFAYTLSYQDEQVQI